jgi:hypothetical protein
MFVNNKYPSITVTPTRSTPTTPKAKIIKVENKVYSPALIKYPVQPRATFSFNPSEFDDHLTTHDLRHSMDEVCAVRNETIRDNNEYIAQYTEDLHNVTLYKEDLIRKITELDELLNRSKLPKEIAINDSKRVQFEPSSSQIVTAKTILSNNAIMDIQKMSKNIVEKPKKTVGMVKSGEYAKRVGIKEDEVKENTKESVKINRWAFYKKMILTAKTQNFKKISYMRCHYCKNDEVIPVEPHSILTAEDMALVSATCKTGHSSILCVKHWEKYITKFPNNEYIHYPHADIFIDTDDVITRVK